MVEDPGTERKHFLSGTVQSVLSRQARPLHWESRQADILLSGKTCGNDILFPGKRYALESICDRSRSIWIRFRGTLKPCNCVESRVYVGVYAPIIVFSEKNLLPPCSPRGGETPGTVSAVRIW